MCNSGEPGAVLEVGGVNISFGPSHFTMENVWILYKTGGNI
jgi:hypothetical protein